MKKMFLAIALVGLVFASNAQTNSKKDKGKKEMKAHVCTAACKDGKHMYAHGEAGHVCTEACKTDKKMPAHGEKGHVCTAACPKM